MEIKKDFYKMIAERRRNLEDDCSNCVGTALYLVGEIDNDLHIEHPNQYIKNLKKTDKQLLGCLIDWEDTISGIYHIAVIVKENPLTLSTRNGKNEKFIKNQLFLEVDSIYKETLWRLKEKNNFYIPSKLQKILDSEAGK